MMLNDKLREITDADIEFCKDSDIWRKRGGVGVFMSMAERWDRIEAEVAPVDNGEQEAVHGNVWDIFSATYGAPSILNDVRDLRRYLLLVEAEGSSPQRAATEEEQQLRRLPSSEPEDGPRERVTHVLRLLAQGHCDCALGDWGDPLSHPASCAYRVLMHSSSEVDREGIG
jgi:hypothetical protein